MVTNPLQNDRGGGMEMLIKIVLMDHKTDSPFTEGVDLGIRPQCQNLLEAYK